MILLITAAGCLQNVRIYDDNDDDRPAALFYGYVGFKNSPASVNEFLLKQLDPPTDKPYYYCQIYRGVYFCYLPVGTYRIERFSSIQSCGERCTETISYNMPAQQNGFVITRPGLFYYNSVRIRQKMTQEFLNTKIESSAEKADWPSEEQILERLLDITNKGSKIEKLIYSRLYQYRTMRRTNAKTNKS